MHRWTTEIGARVGLALLSLCAADCARGREYELRGQVLAVDPSRQEITVKHEDIRGFMPGMTMPFKVRNAALLEGRAPGDLIRATLVVEDSTGYLRAIESVGRAAVTETPPPPRRLILNAGDPVPDVPFVDQAGRSRPLSAWRNQAIAVTFIYTRCPIPDFCPAIDRRFAEVQAEVLKDAALGGRVHLLSVSFDPAYDTPAVLTAHARKVGADPAVWSFLTGDSARIDEFASRLGVQIIKEQGHAQDVVHNLRTAVIDGDGRLVRILNGNEWQAADVVDTLRIVSGKQAAGSASAGR